MESVPMHCHWRLNERSYGALVGKNKKECVAEHGAEQVSQSLSQSVSESRKSRTVIGQYVCTSQARPVNISQVTPSIQPFPPTCLHR
jgi:bisphosphoglycerate-dependent phosphoglycerate mutase